MDSVSTTTTDADFIIALMRTETDALGFIPSTQIKPTWTDRRNYVIVRDQADRPIGYMLHGTPRPGSPLTIHQVCIDYDHRRRRYATAALNHIIRRAVNARATCIRLRCAADLDANQFWLSSGFLPTTMSQGGTRRKRWIVEYVQQVETRRSPLPTPLRI